jgi:hypothetical protein
MQERRKSGRSRALKDAKLFFGSSSMTDCVVRNFTNAGARIEIPNTVELREAFGLTFDGGFRFGPAALSGGRQTRRAWNFSKLADRGPSQTRQGDFNNAY